MKAFKKVSAWLLSLGMAVSLMAAVPVTAAEEQRTGSITVHKFIVETKDEYTKLETAGKNSSGNEINIKTDETLKNLKPMEGIKFDLEKVVDDGTTELKPDTAKKDTSFEALTLPTNKDGELTFENLPFGTYRLSEKTDPRVEKKMDTVLISVPTYNQEYKTDTSKPEFLYEIHVYPKNLIHQNGPDIEKDVATEGNDHATVDRYAPFEWIILSEIPEEVADEKQTPIKYVITDKLDPRLDFVSDVSLEFRTANKQTTTTMTKDTDYEFATAEIKEEGYKEGNKSSLTWTLTDTGRDKLKAYAGGHVVVKFETKLNEKAELGVAIPNKAGLDYINWAGSQYLPQSDEPEVHTGGIKIKKVDKSDHNKKLQGAEFMIYDNEKDAKEAKPEKAVQRNDKPYVETSGEDGIAFFDGLSYGNPTGQNPAEGEKDYWIVETKAPVVDGVQYNRLHDPFKVTISAESHEMEADDMYVVYNAKDNYKLPFTGGAGLIVFLGAGAVLLIAAYVISKGGKSKAAK